MFESPPNPKRCSFTKLIMKRLPLSLLLLLFFIYLGWSVSIRQAALFAVGIGMGAALSGARFGFTTGWRLLIEQRDPRGVAGQLILLALASAFSLTLLGQYSGFNHADCRWVWLGHALQGGAWRTAEHGDFAAVCTRQFSGFGASERLAQAWAT
jgi:hypothetical protein